MKYYAHLKQASEGCDYTIGCGQKLITFEASDDSDAQVKLADIIKNDGYTDDSELSKAFLFKDPIPFDLESVYDDINQAKIIEKATAQKAKDLKEYERLKGVLGQ